MHLYLSMCGPYDVLDFWTCLSWQDYMAKLKDTSTSGAIFFAVCRGKVCPSPLFGIMIWNWKASMYCVHEDNMESTF